MELLIDPAKTSVMIAMPIHRDVPFETVLSLMKTQRLALEKGLKIDVLIRFGNSSAGNARTGMTYDFLQTEYTHLFWIDSDMMWEPVDFTTILALATHLECVGAGYPFKHDPPEASLTTLENMPVEANEYGCFPMRGFGLGFTCVQRHVMEKLSEKAPLRRYPQVDHPIPKVFRADDENGNDRTEDYCFFEDVRSLGYQAWLYPDVTIGHIGRKVYKTPIKDFMRVHERD